MMLSTRLVLLVLGCLLPILTAQVYSQVNLYAERNEQLRGLMLRQAELANAGLTGIVDGVRQLGGTIRHFTAVRTPGERCNERLTALRQNLTQYRYLALFSATDGTLLCGSDAAPAALTKQQPFWAGGLLTTNDVSVGTVMSGAAEKGHLLPIAVRVAGAGPGDQPKVLVAALDTVWLTNHLESAGARHLPDLSRATTIIADQDGNIVARVPDGAAWAGHQVPDWLRPLINRQSQGVETIVDPEGHTFIVGYVPDALSLSGLAVIDVLPLPGPMADIDQATYQNLLVIGAAAIIALILAWVAGRRFIYQPTGALLQAARKWREGDLSARARIADPGSEFAALAESFNAMAAGLHARAMEQRMQSTLLEHQVAERTRELSDTNNRLQVEIAGREKTEAALHQAQKLQAVGQLAGGIAHDFNNMLATVLGNLELMERRVSRAGNEWTGADTDRMNHLIERATGAVTRGAQLTARLLAFSRRQRLAARPTDVNALLLELITLATSTLGRRVQVASDLAEDLWPAMSDPSQLEAAILNLCLNARDAMPDGGRLTIQTSNMTIAAGALAVTGALAMTGDSDLLPGGYVRICISDTGTGMSEDVKAQAFDPFFTTKGPSAGTGLGLSQVYGMARQSGGSVAIESTPNVGTRVILSLPRAATFEGTQPAMAADRGALRVTGMPNTLVLVVDDEHAVRQVTVEMARDLGCEVIQAASGEQALALLDTLPHPPALILLDYAMPAMNGLQLARALRARGVKAPIALVTGYAELSESDVASAELAGLLRKPFTMRELQDLLKQLLAVANADHQHLEPGLAGR